MRAAVVVGVLLVALSGCSGAPEAAPPATPSTGAAPSAIPASDPYLGLARALREEGVEVWWEADLVAAWLDGPTSLTEALRRIGMLSRGVDVVGVKVADELGYADGITSADQARSFLTTVRRGLDSVAPGSEVLVDAIVPELGCVAGRDAAGTACATRARETYPAASISAVDGYLRDGLIDRLDLSTGLLDAATYAERGLDRRRAQEAAWARVSALQWSTRTRLQARKALAAPGGYAGGAAEATADLAVFVDAPVAAGAEAVDVWTWRQAYDGSTVSLLGDDLVANPLWDGLLERRRAGVVLLTHMTPSALPADPGPEVARAAEVFSAVFVAAGTGW
ncbi:hypothetical protein GCM10027425_15600 [Alteromonas gracilis]